MNRFFKVFDEFVAGFGAFSPTQLLFYKILATLICAIFCWLFLRLFILLIEKKIEKNNLILPLSVPAKAVVNFLIITFAGVYLIRLFNIEKVENIFCAIMLLLAAKSTIEIIKTVLDN